MRMWWTLGATVLMLGGLAFGAVWDVPSAAPEPVKAAGTADSMAEAWPPLDDAVIRPGVRIETTPVSPTGIQCTTNFVFSSPDNATLYIGAASHCLAGRAEGETLAVADIPHAGTIVYCSYMHELDLPTCANAPQPASGNDWALIEIHDEHRALVHPAMLHWGGPVGLAQGPATEQSKVYGYGNSSLKPVAAMKPFEGVVVTAYADTTHAVGVMPGVPGDSGSPLLDGSGHALAVQQKPSTNPPGATHALNLEPLLDAMTAATGLEVALATWHLFEPGPVG